MANRVYGYQGKGYQYETSPKKLQPEFEPPEQVKKVKKNKPKSGASKENSVKTKAELKKRASFVVYIIFGFSILFTISYRNSIINEKFNKKENLKSELTEIKKVNEQLEVSLENELNLTTVEKMAKEKLGMSKLSNEQKVYVNLPKKEHIEVTSQGTTSVGIENWYQKICDSIKSFFNI